MKSYNFIKIIMWCVKTTVDPCTTVTIANTKKALLLKGLAHWPKSSPASRNIDVFEHATF